MGLAWNKLCHYCDSFTGEALFEECLGREGQYRHQFYSYSSSEDSSSLSDSHEWEDQEWDLIWDRRDSSQVSVGPLGESKRMPTAMDGSSSAAGITWHSHLLSGAILRSSLFPFLDRDSLYCVGAVCREWRSCSQDEELWKSLCLERWKGKHVPLLEDTVPRIRFVSRRIFSEPMKARSASSLDNGLEDIVLETPPTVIIALLNEKGIIPQAVFPHVTDETLSQSHKVMRLMPWLLLTKDTYKRFRDKLPGWLRLMRGWRWSYHFAEIDSKRCVMTKNELIRTPWIAIFPCKPLNRAVCVLEYALTNSSENDWDSQHDMPEFVVRDDHYGLELDCYATMVACRDKHWGWELNHSTTKWRQYRPPPL